MKYSQELQVAGLSIIILATFAFFTHSSVFTPRAEAAISGTGSGLAAYYTFDDGTGADSSGSGNNGTLANGPLPTTGVVGQGMSFDGVDDKMTMAGVSLPTSFSISMWIKPTAKSGYSTLVMQDSLKGLQINTSNSLTYYQGGEHSTRTALTSGVWQHVVMTSNGSSVTFYINGVQDQNPIAFAVTAPKFNWIGNDSANEKYKGVLDDVRLYNRVLTTSEISQLYALGSGTGTTTPPVNGQCGATTNQCSAGTFSDQTDSQTQNLWQCVGSNGGSTASCSTPISTLSVTTPTSTQAAEIQRFTGTTASTQTAVTLTNGISQGTSAVILLGFEADSTLSLVSATDSKGNTWKIQKTYLYNSVHQMAVLSAYMTTPLAPGDMILLNWNKTSNTDYAGSILSVAGGDSSNSVNANIIGGSFNNVVSVPGQTTVPNTILVGMIQSQQPYTYSGSTWNVIGAQAPFGQSQTTVGLANYYLDGIASAPGTYDPAGQLDSTLTYTGIWLAFVQNGSTVGGGTPPPPPPVNGVCSTTAINACATGTFVDQADVPNAAIWQCSGSNGGTNMQCSSGLKCAQ